MAFRLIFLIDFLCLLCWCSLIMIIFKRMLSFYLLEHYIILISLSST